ncbi:MAG: T9SS type A sorting domain-containing protein, partial [Candidatus Marinimicrobia bacterium]|nr:T9SS type A sorting domain-containing protein [Candidatus Neomarinimicrobiota bacterium]
TFVVDVDTNSTSFGETLWNLTNLTTGEVVLENQLQAKDVDVDVAQLVVSGVQVQVQGPPPDFKDFQVVANAAGPIDPPEGAAADFQGFPSERPTDRQQVGAGHWMFHTGDNGTRGSYGAFLARSLRNDNFDRAVPFDWEMRFTAAGGFAVRAFEDGVVVPVPFELWNVGVATPDDASDDYRLVPWLLTVEGGGGISLNPDGYTVEPTDHSASGGDDDPFTPWIYWIRPADFSPGTAGYDAFVASLDFTVTPPMEGTYAYDGAEIFARTVLLNWNGGSVSDPATFQATVDQLVPEEGTIFRLITTKPNGVSDVFTFDSPLPAQTDIAADIDKINVFPNPYYGFHLLEQSREQKWVKFNHMPEKATIRIFNLGGTMVRVLEKNDPSQYLEWNLKNQAGFPVASGIYIAYIETNFGNKILKLAIVQEEQILQRY